MFYKEHLRYAEETQRGEVAIAGEVQEIRTAATAEVKTDGSPAEEVPAEAPPAVAAAAASSVAAAFGLGGSTQPPPDAAASPAQVAALRSEVTALRELVDRHDKMLRYVMDRYVEKATSSQAREGQASHTHEVSFESVSKSSNNEVGEYKDFKTKQATAGDSHRKRRGGGDALPMGQPEMEGDAGMGSDPMAPSELQIQSQSQGAVKEEVSQVQIQSQSQGAIQEEVPASTTAPAETDAKRSPVHIQKEIENPMNNLGI